MFKDHFKQEYLISLQSQQKLSILAIPSLKFRKKENSNFLVSAYLFSRKIVIILSHVLLSRVFSTLFSF